MLILNVIVTSIDTTACMSGRLQCVWFILCDIRQKMATKNKYFVVPYVQKQAYISKKNIRIYLYEFQIIRREKICDDKWLDEFLAIYPRKPQFTGVKTTLP